MQLRRGCVKFGMLPEGGVATLDTAISAVELSLESEGKDKFP